MLLTSGYIAGGAVAGILIALFAAVPALRAIQDSLGDWEETSNRFFEGPNSNWLGLIPFWIMAVLLYCVGRDLVLKKREKR